MGKRAASLPKYMLLVVRGHTDAMEWDARYPSEGDAMLFGFSTLKEAEDEMEGVIRDSETIDLAINKVVAVRIFEFEQFHPSDDPHWSLIG